MAKQAAKLDYHKRKYEDRVQLMAKKRKTTAVEQRSRENSSHSSSGDGDEDEYVPTDGDSEEEVPGATLKQTAGQKVSELVNVVCGYGYRGKRTHPVRIIPICEEYGPSCQSTQRKLSSVCSHDKIQGEGLS